MRQILRPTLSLVSDLRIDALHFFGNAVVLIAAVLWLRIPDHHAWQLAFTAITALVIVATFAWIHCSTLAHSVRPDQESLAGDFRLGARHLPLFLILGVVLIYMISLSSEYIEHSWQISGYLYTHLPAFLQRWLGEDRFNKLVEYKIVALVWGVLPAIFLPWLAALSAFGIKRSIFRSTLRTYIDWRFWVAIFVAAIIGVWLPRMLMNWTPGHGFAGEIASFSLRFLLAYVLALFGWLLACGAVGTSIIRGARVEVSREPLA